jgi:hypothetical protein
MLGEVIPLWFCAEYAAAGSVSYWSALRAVKDIAVTLWLRLTGADPAWLEALNLATVAGLIVTGRSWTARALLVALLSLQVAALVKRLRSLRESAAMRSAVLATTGIYMIVVSRLWAIECGAEQGVPLLASGVLNLTASRSVWRADGQT